MADQLKEIHNADVYLNSFTGASKSIITTDATTQYVIKDVQVGTNTIPGTEVLSVNGVTTTPTLTTNLSGSEIVDVNSTVSVLLPAAPTFTKDGLAAMSNGYSVGSFYSDSVRYLVAVGSNTGSTIAGTSYPALTVAFNTAYGTVIDHWVINGDVYYWTFQSNSSWGFYKRTGGFNGTETLLKDSNNSGTISQNPGSYGGVLYSATANKFYLIGNNNIVVTYDPLTNTSTSVSINGGSGWPGFSTYSRITLSNNGLIFTVPSTSYTSNVWAINPATGFNINFQSLYDMGNITGWSQDSRIFVQWTGTQYIIHRQQGSTGYPTATNPSVPPTFPTSSSTYYSSYNTTTGYSYSLGYPNNLWSMPDLYTANNASFMWVQTLSSTAPVVRLFTMSNLNLSDTTLSGTINSYQGFKGYTPAATPTAGEIASITNYPQRIRLRVTGVQTTL